MALRGENSQYGGKGMLVGDSDRQFLWYLQLKKAWAEAGGCLRHSAIPLRPRRCAGAPETSKETT